jgi:hypothetical protein
MKMCMSATCVTGEPEILETCSESKMLEIAWIRENNVDWTGNQTAWITRVMAVLTYGHRVTLPPVQCTPTTTRSGEMMHLPGHTGMISEGDIGRPLIYNPREEKNRLPFARNISFPART